MRDDFGPPRRPRKIGLLTTVLVAVIVSIAVAFTAEPSESDHDGGFSWRGVRLNRSLPDAPAASPSVAPEPGVTQPDDAGTAGVGIPPRSDHARMLTVTHVFDGDTIEAVSSGNAVLLRIRLIGIDTPEGTPTLECWADEARVHLSQLLPEGSTVWAAPDTQTRDRYDRALYYLWTDDGRFVNHELVAAGDAEAIRVWPNVAHSDLLSAAQAEAEASRAGRWGACA